jgi:hypothetical protein
VDWPKELKKDWHPSEFFELVWAEFKSVSGAVKNGIDEKPASFKNLATLLLSPLLSSFMTRIPLDLHISSASLNVALKILQFKKYFSKSDYFFRRYKINSSSYIYFRSRIDWLQLKLPEIFRIKNER